MTQEMISTILFFFISPAALFSQRYGFLPSVALLGSIDTDFFRSFLCSLVLALGLSLGT